MAGLSSCLLHWRRMSVLSLIAADSSLFIASKGLAFGFSPKPSAKAFLSIHEHIPANSEMPGIPTEPMGRLGEYQAFRCLFHLSCLVNCGQ